MHRFDATTERIAELCFDYAAERLRLDPVPLDGPTTPEALQAATGETITPAGLGADAAMAVFRDVLAPACLSNDSERYLAFIPAAPTKAAQLFDVVVSSSGICGSSWLEGAGAVHAENQALRWLADLAGFGPRAGGVFVSGGSAGNLSALVVAREIGAARLGRPGARLRVAVGEQAHSSVASTLRIIGCDALVVPSDATDRLTGDALASTLRDDPEPETVVAVVATAGTTNAGIIDDLEGVGEVARTRDLWFHVDGAYGLAALASPGHRAFFAGIERADSFTVDPHKWLFAPFDCAALVYAEPDLARGVHAQHASYLDAIHDTDDWNPADLAYHLTRRARGLPFWFSLAVHGTDAYAAAIGRSTERAEALASRVEAAPHTELVRTPSLGIVLWRRPGWEPDDYRAWSRRLLEEQRAFVLPSRWHGEVVARAVCIHPELSDRVLDDLVASMA
ncbi:MAG: pyridoxal phosphate-dependent decarboxylase family protein [Actinomycetes bacterium]